MTDLQAYYRGSLAKRSEALEAFLPDLAQEDVEARNAVRRIAHALKGTGTSYGFPEITEAAAAVLAASDDDLSSATETLIATMRRIAAGGETDEDFA